MDLPFFELIRNQLQRQALNADRRFLRDANNPLMIPDGLFKQLYRISKNMAHWLINEIIPHMTDEQRVTCLPKHIRIFAALQFMAQKAVEQDFLTTMSQSSVSRCLSEVTDLLVQHLGHIVHFPNTDEERNNKKMGFMAVNNGFPGIIGCVDGTQIAIIAPPTHDPDQPGVIFYCRKGFYSLNVQIICNADLKIMNVNARFPGSSHDAGIGKCQMLEIF